MESCGSFNVDDLPDLAVDLALSFLDWPFSVRAAICLCGGCLDLALRPQFNIFLQQSTHLAASKLAIAARVPPPL